VDSGYCPVPCGIPQGSRISECEGAWEFRTPEFPEFPETRDERRIRRDEMRMRWGYCCRTRWGKKAKDQIW